jgi:hypothetical protein
MYELDSLLYALSSLQDLFRLFVIDLFQRFFLELQSVQIIFKFNLSFFFLSLQFGEMVLDLCFFLGIIAVIEHHFFSLAFVLFNHLFDASLYFFLCGLDVVYSLYLFILGGEG